MSADPEIEHWRTVWIAVAPQVRCASSEARRGAARQQLRLRAWHVAELVAAAVFLVFSAWFLSQYPTFEVFVWAAVVWASTFAVTAFSVWNWRILWQSDMKSVAEYASVYESRCIAMLRAVRFGLWFLAVQAAISVPWLVVRFAEGRMSGGRLVIALGILAGWIAGFLSLAGHQWRSAHAELNQVLRSRETAETQI